MVESKGPLSALLGDPHEDKHYEAIGRFVVAFAQAESFAHVSLRHHSGLSEALGRAIFGGKRISDATEIFRSVVRAKNDAQLYAEIDNLLTQLTLISNERGRIVHRETSYEEAKGLIVTNAKISKGLPEIDTYSYIDIAQMTSDCKVIGLRFRLTMIDYGFNSEETDFLYEPWSYKPPLRGNKHRNPRDVT